MLTQTLLTQTHMPIWRTMASILARPAFAPNSFPKRLSFRPGFHSVGLRLNSARMNLPTLNQTLWTLLIALLSAAGGWTVMYLAARVERERGERRRRRGFED